MVTMRTVKVALAVGLFVLGASVVRASGPLGIVAVVDKVVFEPNEANAERIQVWGAFASAEGGTARLNQFSPAKKGYMYFRIPEAASAAQRQAIRNEWADLKAVAGKGEAVGFGQWFYIGGFGAPTGVYGMTGGSQVDLRARPASEAPANPIEYVTNIGLVKIRAEGTHAAIIQQLKDALAAK